MSIFNLDGKTILVTGGYGYLGSAMSKGLAETGAQVCVLGRSREKFDVAFHNDSSKIGFFECDISDSDSIQTAIESAVARHGSLDVLINNAVYLRGKEPLDISDDDWAFGIDGVLNSTYRCIRSAAPFFQSQGHGNIINIGSMYGMVAPDFAVYDSAPAYLNKPHYGAAKAAVIQMTRYFARFLGRSNIRVNCISPGPFPNPDGNPDETFIQELGKRTCLGRVGRPQELVGAAVYLSSSASSYVSGQNIAVDGGWTAT